jgi:hypothetical protein
MKHSKPSSTAVQTDTADIGRDRFSTLQTRTVRFSKLMKGVWGILSLALIVTVYVLAHRSFSNHEIQADKLPRTSEQVLEVEVLDGAGNMRVAQQVTNVLRAQGYDVVEMKKNSEGLIERTYVIDRSGNLDAARKLATSLGVAQDKVFQKIDRNLYLDVSILVGKDYSRLKLFQILSERSKH